MGKLGLSARPTLFPCATHSVSGQYALPLALMRTKRKLGVRINTTAAHLTVAVLGHRISGNGYGYAAFILKRRGRGVRLHKNQSLTCLYDRAMDGFMGSEAIVHVDVPGLSASEIVGRLGSALLAKMDSGCDIQETLGVDPSTQSVAYLVPPKPLSGVFVVSMGLFDSAETGADVCMTKGIAGMVDGAVTVFHKGVKEAFPDWVDELGDWMTLKSEEAGTRKRGERR